MLPTTLRIATRKSALALTQAHYVQRCLQKQYPDCLIELVEVTTTGDKIQDKPLAEIGGKGLFIKALEEAILQGRADLAVHSLKDVPPDLPPQFTLAAISERESPYDVLVSNSYSNLDTLPQAALIGTGSVRRRAEILHYRPDLKVQSIRGNVDSRLKKLDEGQFDAIILAEAGLNRLGLQQRISQVLPAEICLPSVGQGALAIECLSQSQDLIKALGFFNHQPTRYCIEAERAMNLGLQASCVSPVGSFARIERHELILKGLVASQDGQHVIKVEHRGEPKQAIQIGQAAAAELIAKGAKQWLD